MNYTSIEQSKKLAEILPIESADMCYRYYSGGMITGYGDCVLAKSFITGKDVIRENDLPCWSLASLLDVLPYCQDLSKHTDGKWYITTYPNDVHTCLMAYDNPVDACVAMIENLHEFKML